MASRVAGTVDVDGLKATTSRRMLERWRSYLRLFPFGDDWEQAGTIAAAVMNSSGRMRRQKRPSDFVPAVRAARRQTIEQIGHHLRLILGGP